MSEVAILPVAAPPPRQIIQVVDPIPVLDTGRFEQMQRIATVMAETSMMPDSLRCVKDGDNLIELPPKKVMANCFMVVNQAVRWGMDPFAVAQSVSIVRGKLCYEGKLVAAVLDAKLGVRLGYDWDNKTGDAAGIVVSGTLPGELTARTISGTVGDWKTPKGPWTTPLACRRQLAYRGAREWARIHAPALMLGVYTSDEMDTMSSERSSTVRVEAPFEIAPPARRTPPAPPPPPAAQITAPASKAPPAPPQPPQQAFDMGTFIRMVRDAGSVEDINAVYAQLVEGKGLPEDVLTECDAVVGESAARFDEAPEID